MTWENSKAGEVLAQTVLIGVEGCVVGCVTWEEGMRTDGERTYCAPLGRKVTLVEEQGSPESLLG